MQTALSFDRASLDLNNSRDGLIFDLQNTETVLRNHGQQISFLRGQCEALVESGVWNAEELSTLLGSKSVTVFQYHGALRRSLQQKF
jgi:hypothetical protein